MTDEELITYLRFQGLDKDIAAASRIDELVIEVDETHEEAMSYLEMWGAALAAQREAEAKLAKAVVALDEAIYLLDPDEEDIAKEAGLYRIVTTRDQLKGET